MNKPNLSVFPVRPIHDMRQEQVFRPGPVPALLLLFVVLGLMPGCSSPQTSPESLKKQWREEKLEIEKQVARCSLPLPEAIRRLEERQQALRPRVEVGFSPARFEKAAREGNCKP